MLSAVRQILNISCLGAFKILNLKIIKKSVCDYYYYYKIWVKNIIKEEKYWCCSV